MVPFFDHVGKVKIAFFMVFFGNGDIAHHGRQFGETFFLGRIGETGDTCQRLLMFAGGGFHKVVNRIAITPAGNEPLISTGRLQGKLKRRLAWALFLLGGFL